jgi:hypothetical protein
VVPRTLAGGLARPLCVTGHHLDNREGADLTARPRSVNTPARILEPTSGRACCNRHPG